jgi:hypothetical protein
LLYLLCRLLFLLIVTMKEFGSGSGSLVFQEAGFSVASSDVLKLVTDKKKKIPLKAWTSDSGRFFSIMPSEEFCLQMVP